MQQPNRHRLWIVAISFWVFFIAAIALQRYYPWLDTAFYVLLLLVIVVASFYSVREMFRRVEQTGEYVY